GAPPGPRVLVTMDRRDAPGGGEVFIGADYVDAVCAAGGAPWLAPPGEPDADALLDGVDALVITGGAFDIHPRWYGQEVAGRLDRVEPSRTAMELALAQRALARDLPVLGICGGMQVLAVAAGGSLVQDLPPEPSHEQATDPATPWHPVRLAAPLAGWLGAQIDVNSTHHQAVDAPGRGFEACGWSPDGVIEAMVAPALRFAVGVQWHPERLGDARMYRRLIASMGTSHT
ncbi:MAG TPA: gamma-glutamyl-gamma-aminobutyrate hydrolase family protein, partial [Myxococcota bacterium]|nr:gamma-glutamyl-gamma-aminobutyrate hydrolase family protein [Myxococcota bacterium]